MLGQNLVPRNHDPRVRRLPEQALRQAGGSLKQRVHDAAAATPDHGAYIRKMGAASDTGPLLAGRG